MSTTKTYISGDTLTDGTSTDHPIIDDSLSGRRRYRRVKETHDARTRLQPPSPFQLATLPIQNTGHKAMATLDLPQPR